MTDVRVRHEDQNWHEAVHLTDVPFDQIEFVIPMLERWAIAGHEDKDLSGQFVLLPSGMFFEVTIHEADS